MTAVEHGICEVLRDGRAVGLGFAVDPAHVVTCAHVINSALGRRDRLDGSRPWPDDYIRVRFPLGGRPGKESSREGRVVGWLPDRTRVLDSDDLALLELSGGVPRHVPVLHPMRPQRSMRVQMWGPQQDRPGGGHVTGELLGEVGGGRIQVNAVGGRFRVRPGFSGGPVWETRTGGVVGVMQAFGSEADADDAYLIGGGQIARIWPRWGQGGYEQPRAGNAPAVGLPERLVCTIPHRSTTGISFSQDGNLLALGADRDRTVTLYDPDTGMRVRTLGQVNRVLDAAFSPDGTLLASTDGFAVRLWETHAWTTRHLLTDPRVEMQTLAFSPNGAMLACGGGGQAIGMWDTTTGQSLVPLHISDMTWSWSVAIGPDGFTLVVAGDFGLQVWIPGSNEHLEATLDSMEKYSRVAFSPTAPLLAAVGSQSITVWETSKWTQVASFVCDEVYDMGLAFSPDGTLLAAGGVDGTVRIWGTATWEPLRTITGHAEDKWVTRVAFSPDGRLLASASTDGTVRVWG
jgi:WD40 repeat protein